MEVYNNDGQLVRFTNLLKHSTMIYFRLLLISFAFSILFISCAKEEVETETEQTVSQADYREEFTGVYSCEKSSTKDFTFTTDIEITIALDTSSIDGLIIGEVIIPVGENGSYGPEFLTETMNYYVRFEQGELYLESYALIENGIMLPCFIRGSKK